MNKTTLTLLTLIFTLSVTAQSVATYDISFSGTWNATDHAHMGQSLPGSAHWSDLVGANHNGDITFVEMGQPASPGIEDVAEIGVNTVFQSEVQAQITNGDAQQWLQMGFSPFAAISTATLTDVEISSDFPLLSLASMIAPSPDWFIAINSLNLMNPDGTWKTSIVMDLFPYDAGTEDGFNYSLNNAPTVGGVVTRIDGAANYPFQAGKEVGTLTITLKSVLSVDDVEIAQAITIFPNPTDEGIVTMNTTKPIKEVSIYNVLGKEVKRFKYTNQNSIGNKTMDITDLTDGIYMMRVMGEDGAVTTKKLIKN